MLELKTSPLKPPTESSPSISSSEYDFSTFEFSKYPMNPPTMFSPSIEFFE